MQVKMQPSSDPLQLFQRTVEEQLGLVQKMHLEQMEFAWEIWQNATKQLHDLILKEKAKTSDVLPQEDESKVEHLEDVAERNSDVETTSTTSNFNQYKKKTDNTDTLTHARKSNRIRTTPRKYENAAVLLGKRRARHSGEAASGLSSSPESVSAELNNSLLQEESVPQENESDPAELKKTESNEQNLVANEQSPVANEQNTVANAIVKNFITQICRAHGAADPNVKIVTSMESEEEDVPVEIDKEPAKKKKMKGEGNNSKRGRKSKYSEEEMVQLGFKRLENKRFGCLTCEMTFLTPTKALVHTRKHTGSRPYKCSQCEKAFTCEFYLHRHEVIHNKELLFSCPEEGCGKSYMEKRALDKHMESRHQQGNGEGKEESKQDYFKCDECGKEMKYKVNLKVHKKLCHEGSREHQCSYCGLLFQTKANLIRHHACHTQVRPHGCTLCSQKFKTPNCLQKHMMLHKEKPHKCDICERGFETKFKLEKHIESHDDNTTFLCEQCGAEFRHRNTLRTHYKVHFADRVFKCAVCDWAFYTNSDLQRHKLSHSQDRLFECQICNKRYRRRDGLRKHLRVHGDAAIYRCFYCGKSFWDKLKGKRHVLWCKGDNHEGKEFVPIGLPEEPADTEIIEQQAEQDRFVQIVDMAPDADKAEELQETPSTVLNLTGMNLDILDVNSSYIIVRKQLGEGDTTEENEQIVITNSGPPVSDIPTLQHEALQNAVSEIMHIQTTDSISEGKEMDDVLELNQTITNAGSDGIQITINEGTIVSPLEQAMQQAGLHHVHGQELLQPDSQPDSHVGEMLSTVYTNEPSASIQDHSSVDLPLQFEESANEDPGTFSLNQIGGFPNVDAECPTQTDNDCSKVDECDQWLQW